MKKMTDNAGSDADVVVIGGGGAGLAAAVAAAEKGARVTVLEKRGLGGTSAMAFGIFAAESPVQKRAGINCSGDECFKIAMDFAHWRINPSIVRALIDKSSDTIAWLEAKGLEFECGAFNPDQEPVFHLVKGRGAALMKTLADNCRNNGVQLHIHAPAKKILTGETGRINGVLAETKGEEFTVRTGSIIIATGGFGGNKELLEKYCPEYHEGMERIGLPHTGDGLKMANEIGAANEGLGILMLGMPSAFHPPDLSVKTDALPSLSQIGLISLASDPRTLWVNKKGKRFTDEDFNRAHFLSGNAIVRQPDNVCYTIFDSEITRTIARLGPVRAKSLPETESGDRLPELEKDLQIMEEKGLVRIFGSREEMAGWMGANPEVLEATITDYNAACEAGHDPVFSKDPKYLLPLRSAPYYAIKWGASYLNTVGGIKVNEYMEVIDKQGEPIPGLYAAGVDTGGWESETYCMRLPGHAFGFAINSGRIAGEKAAGTALKK